MSRACGPAWLVVAGLASLPLSGWSQAVEEIVVTTRKKEEKLQDVPIAITAITAEQIERQGIKDLNDVVKLSPSVQFDTGYGPADTRVTIRGISNNRGRSNVAFLVDGVDVTTENLVAAGSGLLANRRLLNDVQSIELVKGPQSALYGRSAFAGAISYTTKDPSETFESSASVEAAQDGLYQVGGMVSGPLTDTIGLRVNGVYYKEGGHYVNSMSGEPVGDSYGVGGAVTALIQPEQGIRLKIRAEYSNDHYGPRANVRIGGGWQDGDSIALYHYPKEVLQNAQAMAAVYQTAVGLGKDSSLINGLGFARNTNSTGLLDFGQYCPDRLRGVHGDNSPGICLPSSFGTGSGRVVAQSEDPFTGRDYPGTNTETFRVSFKGDIQLDKGMFSTFGGWTDFNARDRYDQDWQANPNYDYCAWFNQPNLTFSPGTAPTSPSCMPSAPVSDSIQNLLGTRPPDRLLGAQQSDASYDTKQSSLEIRYSSKLDGPINYAVGALYWNEVRRLDERNFILSCFPSVKAGTYGGPTSLPYFTYDNGVCDGTPSKDPTPVPTVNSWQELAREIGLADGSGLTPAPWDARTRHWSFYGNVDWNFADDWQVSLEDRWISEHFKLMRPNQSSCTIIATTPTIALVWPQGNRGDKLGNNVLACSSSVLFDPNLDLGTYPPGSILTPSNSERLLESTIGSNYNTPKVTLRWLVSPDNQLYFYWARGAKPAGISPLAGGASAATLEQLKFDSEKLDAWEFGSKNKFDARGPLIANGALFFSNYTAKQIGTQFIDATGVSAQRIINEPATVWGFELELNWRPDVVEGLTLGAAYTFTDAKWGDYVEDVTSLTRIAYLGRCDQLVYLGKLGIGGADKNDLSDPRNGGAACREHYNGNALDRTPKHQFIGTANFTRPLFKTGLEWFIEGNANYESSRYNDQDNGVRFLPFWQVDTRLGLTGDRWDITAYVNNVFNDNTIRTGGSGPDFGRQVSDLGFTAGLGTSQWFGTLPDPRIFGMRANIRFGGGR